MHSPGVRVGGVMRWRVGDNETLLIRNILHLALLSLPPPTVLPPVDMMHPSAEPRWKLSCSRDFLVAGGCFRRRWCAEVVTVCGIIVCSPLCPRCSSSGSASPERPLLLPGEEIRPRLRPRHQHHFHRVVYRRRHCLHRPSGRGMEAAIRRGGFSANLEGKGESDSALECGREVEAEGVFLCLAHMVQRLRR